MNSPTACIEMMLWKNYQYGLPAAPRDMAIEIIKSLYDGGFRVVPPETDVNTGEHIITVAIKPREDLPALQTRLEVQAMASVLLKYGEFFESARVTDWWGTNADIPSV
jgi:hypothetical protein